MKKTELKEGQEYAMGSPSRYDRWSYAHVKVLAIEKGILVEFVEDSTTFRYRGRAGEQRLLDSARGFQSLWSEYVESKRAYDEEQAKRRAKEKRVEAIADDALVRLRSLGFDADRSYGASLRWERDGTFTVSAVDMFKLLALIP